MMTAQQLTLPVIGPSTIQARFEAWLATSDGQFMYRWLAEAAHGLRARGFRHYGIGALWEAARYSRDVAVGPDQDGFKLNDHYRSRMARQLMADDSALEGFFELRELRAA